MICVLSGGVGAARLLRALSEYDPALDLRAVVNVGDDLVMHGLQICPDLDTITYTLAGLNNEEQGWGLTGETWRVMQELGALGGDAWFGLGDRDLATHLYRTQRLHAGSNKTEVAAEIAHHFQLGVDLLPATNDPLATEFHTEVGILSFQEYFVRHHHDVVVTSIDFRGAAAARLTSQAADALREADRIVIAPSNPLISIGPILAIPGVREALRERRDDVIAVSPIIGGAALKGPADRLLRELGHDVSPVGVARYYRDLVGTMVIDEVDVELRASIEELGLECRVTTTIMKNPDHARHLAAVVMA